MNMSKSLIAISAGAALSALLVTPATSVADPQGLDVGKASRDLAYQPGPRTPGKLKIRSVIDDNDTENLTADLLTNTVTVRVQDSGSFDVTATLEGCIQTVASVRCVSDSSGFRVKAFTKPWKNYPDVYLLNLRVKDLNEAETGSGPLEAPVTVTVTHGSRIRTDVVAQAGGNEGDCKLKKNGTRLRCRAR